MRFAIATFAAALVLFLAGSASLAGSWAVSVGCVLFLLAAIVGAVSMEERDLTAVEGLLPRERPEVAAVDEVAAETQGPLVDAI
jgi:hypothetical protein